MEQSSNVIDPAVTGVQRCLDEIRQMIVSAELLPGQKVHQGEVAKKLNLSRIPVREALSTLQAEGVLAYKANTGFTVVRFSGEDLAQVYLMRRLLEKEILTSIDLAQVNTDELISLNNELAACAESGDAIGQLHANHLFHFRLFEYSPLSIVRKEVERLWNMSSAYRSLYIYDPTSSRHVLEDHERILDAIRDGDAEALVRISDEHRSSTEDLVLKRLRPRLR